MRARAVTISTVTLLTVAGASALSGYPTNAHAEALRNFQWGRGLPGHTVMIRRSSFLIAPQRRRIAAA